MTQDELETEARRLFGSNFRRLSLLAKPLDPSDPCDHADCKGAWARLILIQMFINSPTVYQYKACPSHAAEWHGRSVDGPGGFPWRP